MFSKRDITLPCVFDLETGEIHEGTTAFNLVEAQGREVFPSEIRGPGGATFVGTTVDGKKTPHGILGEE